MAVQTMVASPVAKRAVAAKRDFGAQLATLEKMHATMMGHAALDGRPDLDVGENAATLYLWCRSSVEAFEVTGLLLNASMDAGLSLATRPSASPLNDGEWCCKVSAVRS
jgi:hypothetical protein